MTAFNQPIETVLLTLYTHYAWNQNSIFHIVLFNHFLDDMVMLTWLVTQIFLLWHYTAIISLTFVMNQGRNMTVVLATLLWKVASWTVRRYICFHFLRLVIYALMFQDIKDQALSLAGYLRLVRCLSLTFYFFCLCNLSI